MEFESNNNKTHQHIHTGFPMSISMRVQSLEIPSVLVHHLSVRALQPFDPCINNSIIPLNPRHQSSFSQHHHYTHHSRQPPSFASDHPVRSSSSSKLLRLSSHQPARAKTRGIEIHDENKIHNRSIHFLTRARVRSRSPKTPRNSPPPLNSSGQATRRAKKKER